MKVACLALKEPGGFHKEELFSSEWKAKDPKGWQPQLDKKKSEAAHVSSERHWRYYEKVALSLLQE